MTFGTEFIEELERLENEAKIVFLELVLPNWGGPRHGFPDTLYGYMMGAFARIDLVSAHWHGSFDDQTGRMIRFMDRYLDSDHEANSASVQIWRHKLMHTASPRTLRDGKTGKVYLWLLQWGEQHMPKEQHYKFQSGSSDRILNIGLLNLVAAIKIAVAAYITDLRAQPELEENYQKIVKELETYEFRHI